MHSLIMSHNQTNTESKTFDNAFSNAVFHARGNKTHKKALMLSLTEVEDMIRMCSNNWKSKKAAKSAKATKAIKRVITKSKVLNLVKKAGQLFC